MASTGRVGAAAAVAVSVDVEAEKKGSDREGAVGHEAAVTDVAAQARVAVRQMMGWTAEYVEGQGTE